MGENSCMARKTVLSLTFLRILFRELESKILASNLVSNYRNSEVWLSWFSSTATWVTMYGVWKHPSIDNFWQDTSPMRSLYQPLWVWGTRAMLSPTDHCTVCTLYPPAGCFPYSYLLWILSIHTDISIRGMEYDLVHVWTRQMSSTLHYLTYLATLHYTHTHTHSCILYNTILESISIHLYAFA